MKILKFGGTSVGSAQRMRDVASLVKERGRNVIVLSAMSGTTNSLLEISKFSVSGDSTNAFNLSKTLKNKHLDTVEELFIDNKFKAEAKEKIEEIFRNLDSKIRECETNPEKEIVSNGELLSTAIMNLKLREMGINSALISALDFMRKNENDEPDMSYISSHLDKILSEEKDAELFVTQGFICRSAEGNIDNLKRGGSDYSASIIGAAINADEIEIWTDINGMHNNDPRFVDNTTPVHNLNFEEAAELAYFGAKILHPTCILPAKNSNIPVRLLNTMDPDAEGTLINCDFVDHNIKAVAAKDSITAIKIKSSRMLLAYGFLKRVFEIFERYRTPIDMIATSEVGVSLTIDNDSYLHEIVANLEKLGTVTVDKDMVIICIVGDLDWQNCGYEALALDALRDIPVRMISYGGSNYNISFLIKKEDKVKALRQLSNHLFKKK